MPGYNITAEILLKITEAAESQLRKCWNTVESIAERARFHVVYSVETRQGVQWYPGCKRDIIRR